MFFRDADRGAGLRISPKRPSRPNLDGKCSEATYLHSIASDQCRNDLVEDDIDDFSNVLGEQMRILLCDAQNQEACPAPRTSLSG